jgi:hypothetical protein
MKSPMKTAFFLFLEGGVKRYRLKLADYAAVVDELDAVDW